MTPPPDPHYRHRFPAAIISHAVWLYCVFSLSLRGSSSICVIWLLAADSWGSIALRAFLARSCSMKSQSEWALGPGLQVLSAERQDTGWVVTARASGSGRCPACGARSLHPHGWHVRQLQDLPVQGVAVTLSLVVGRWRCRDPRCQRQTFTARLSLVAEPFARRTRRVSNLARLLAHAAGGRPAERLMARLGPPQVDDSLFAITEAARGRPQ